MHTQTMTPTQLAARQRFYALRSSIAERAKSISENVKKVEIKDLDIPQKVQMTDKEADAAFGPHIPTIDDLAFGPIVHPRPIPFRAPDIKAIQTVVCQHFKVSMADLLSGRRSQDIVWPRQIAMYLCKTLTVRSLPEIGRRFGGRDHTTVIHAVRKISLAVDQSDELANEIAALSTEVERVKRTSIF